MPIQCYQNNPRLKDSGQKIAYSQDMINEMARCAKDPVYFIKKYVKIINVDNGIVPFELYPYEERYIRTMHSNRFVICKFPRQSGKALSLDTKIPTPNGYTTMGEISVGDVVYGNDGKETTVTMATDVMYDHSCYEIVFDNGEKVVADAEHLWEVSCSDWNNKPKVHTTREIVDIFQKKSGNGQGLWIQATKPVVGKKEENLPIKPYTLGVWLGDGETRGSRITTHKLDYDDISSSIESEGYSLVSNKTKNPNIVLYNIVGLRTTLKDVGLFGDKHIPDVYKRASVEQRMDLVCGLMDTDGSCDSDGSCEFYQKKFRLVQDFREVLSSLGIKSRIRESEINGETYYTVSFSTKLPVFKLHRKLRRQQKLVNHPKNERIYFKSIRVVDSVPVRCISVNNENHMFLFGETMVPTHNSTTTIAYFLWYILFNDNVKIAILANKGETAQELMSRLQFAYEFLPFWIQQGILTWNKRSIELENGSKIRAAATSSSAVRGDTFNIIFLDEFAHIDPPRLAEEFFTSVYPTIASGKTTKVFIVSTPKGMNLFYKLWINAIEGRSEYVPLEINWWDVPGRDENWKIQTIKNTSEEQFTQEFDCTFLGSTGTLINPAKLRQMSFRTPTKSIHGLDVYVPPMQGHIYTLAVDTAQGKGRDYHAVQVIDVTKLPYLQVAKYRNHHTPVILLPNIITQIAKMYNDASILIEVMDTGMQVADMIHFDLEYENLVHVTIKGRHGQIVGGGFSKTFQRGLKMTPQARRQGCMNLKALVEQDKLIIQDFDTIQELTTFISNGKNGKFEAEEGCHDDLVMSLVVFSWLAAQRYFRESADNIDVRLQMEEDNRRWIEDEMIIPLMIDDGINGYGIEVDRAGDIWTPVAR